MNNLITNLIKQSDLIDSKITHYSKLLNEKCKNSKTSMGLTSDEMKNNPEYIELKMKYNFHFQEQRNFVTLNKKNLKAMSKERRKKW